MGYSIVLWTPVIWVAFWLCVAMVLVYSKAQTSIQYPSTILKFVVEWPQH